MACDQNLDSKSQKKPDSETRLMKQCRNENVTQMHDTQYT